MKRLLICGLLAAAYVQLASAVTLDFDSIPGGSLQNSAGFMPGSYQGYAFTETLQRIDLVDSPWNFGAVSGEFGLLNNFSGVGVVTQVGGGAFTFDGLWAKEWATSPQSGGPADLFGTLSGYNNGNLVWSVDTALNGSYQFFCRPGRPDRRTPPRLRQPLPGRRPLAERRHGRARARASML